ncbi:uncharacterized protein LOC110383669 [Helicoverpa armigera]|uniref:uncharacterized protein LOC110383669 n=1 Tax=Helicoverpa armigera TaxID=29058 RepID=UPI003083AC8F
MNLIQNILPLYLLLEINIAMRNSHYPHYYHSRGMQHEMRHDDYQHYDSYSSDGRVMRTHRKKYHYRKPNSEESESITWENLKRDRERDCRCSCSQCKSILKACCSDFCSTQCGTFNNLIVVPYPVPFVVLNQSETSAPRARTPDTTASTATSTATTTATTTIQTTTAKSTTSTNIPMSRRTVAETSSTLSYFELSKLKRFRIIHDKKNRRNMDYDLHTPKFDKLPKYGIVPIPEKLAMSLMSQMRAGNKGQLQHRMDLDNRARHVQRDLTFQKSARLRRSRAGSPTIYF